MSGSDSVRPDLRTPPTAEEIAELRSIAEAATPGPWKQTPNTAAGQVWVEARPAGADVHDFAPIFSVRTQPEFAQRERDARFVATFNPALVLQLLDALAVAAHLLPSATPPSDWVWRYERYDDEQLRGAAASIRVYFPDVADVVERIVDEAIARGASATPPSTDELKAQNERLRSALAHIGADMHNTSTRPCTTCSYVTKMRGIDFGCVVFAKEQQAKRAAVGDTSHTPKEA
jgi:hypothetical protein